MAVQEEDVNAAQYADADQQKDGQNADANPLNGRCLSQDKGGYGCEKEKTGREKKKGKEFFQDRITLYNGSTSSITLRRWIEKRSFLTVL